jgi:hypothetical protein
MLLCIGPSLTWSPPQKTFGEPATKRSLLLEEREANGLSCPLSGGLNVKQPILDLNAPAPA